MMAESPFDTETPQGPIAPQADVTDRQVAFIRSLADERGQGEQVESLIPKLSRTDASALIDLLKTLPRKATNRGAVAEGAPASATNPALVVGVYRNEAGELFRVYPARGGSHLLAKQINIQDGEVWFQYVGAAGRFVRPGQLLPAAEAASYGSQFGSCMVCEAELTDPDSVAAGIGPICASKYGR